MRARFLSACSLVVLFAWSSSVVAAAPETTGTAKPATAKPADAERAPDQLRDAILAAMKRTNSMAERSVADRIDEPAVCELLVLYRVLQTDTKLPAAERDALSAQLRIRLARIGKTIDRSLKRSAKASTTKSSTAKTGPAKTSMASSTSVEGAKGGGPVDHGQDLLKIIKATIAPDSWDDQGGSGTIYYWPAWHVLVIRQTDEVHEQIEGLLKALR